MPLYEYRCTDCDHHFERIEKASALHDGICPVCGGPARRLLGAPALKFKGSGWYVTDYGKGNGSRDTSPETKTGSSESPPAAGGKSETGKTSDTSSKVA